MAHCRASLVVSRSAISHWLTTHREIRCDGISIPDRSAIHLCYQAHCFRMILSMRWPSPSKYLEGQIISGDISSASAMSFSPRGHGRLMAFASVEELNPALRESAAIDVPFFLNPAKISAGCQSGCIMPSPR